MRIPRQPYKLMLNNERMINIKWHNGSSAAVMFELKYEEMQIVT